MIWDLLFEGLIPLLCSKHCTTTMLFRIFFHLLFFLIFRETVFNVSCDFEQDYSTCIKYLILSTWLFCSHRSPLYLFYFSFFFYLYSIREPTFHQILCCKQNFSSIFTVAEHFFFQPTISFCGFSLSLIRIIHNNTNISQLKSEYLILYTFWLLLILTFTLLTWINNILLSK